MLEPIKNAYYNTLGNSLSAIQELQARMGYIPDRESAYVTQMGRTPFSLRSHKYGGDNTFIILPALASKPGKDMNETVLNYIDKIGKQKPGSNRILVRTHTHPVKLQGKNKVFDIGKSLKSPSPQDFVNAATVYSLPQNSNLRYNRNKIYTKENGKNVRYIYDVPEHVKEQMRKGGDAAIYKYAISQNLGMIPEEIKASARGMFDTLRGKGNYTELATNYLNENIYNKYKRMGYPIIRQEF